MKYFFLFLIQYLYKNMKNNQKSSHYKINKNLLKLITL